MKKNSLHTAVNILGLTAGLTFALLISCYIWSEVEVNHQLKEYKDQYIIQSHWKKSEMGMELTTVGPLAKALKEHYPDLVANYYRFDGIAAIITRDEHSFKENIALGDSTLLGMYGFSLEAGNPVTALKSPYSVVLTAEKAIKYFGKKDVIGKTIRISSFSGSAHDFIITGLLKKPFRNSVTSLNASNNNQFFVSTANLTFFGRNMNWNNSDIVSFIQLHKGVHPGDLDEPIRRLLLDNTGKQIPANLKPYLSPLSSWYLKGNNGQVYKSVLGMSLIAVFILFMAIVNFINLSTSQSTSRLKEISLRKVMGGMRKQLILQFLTESITLVFFSTLLSLACFAFFKGWFSQILYQPLPSLTEFPVYFISLPFLLILIIGFIAGIYPAFILSSLKVAAALKGKFTMREGKSGMQKLLLGFQFLTATLVIVCALIISRQVSFFLNTSLGYSKEYVITAAVPRDYSPAGLAHMINIRNQLKTLPEVENSSLSYSILDGNSAGSISYYKAGTDSTEVVSGDAVYADENFASTYGIRMDDGSFFGKSGHNDSTGVVINQAAARMFGWTGKNQAIGKQIRTWGDPRTYTVTGVTSDFHFGSLSSTIKPVIFQYVSLFYLYRYLCIKLKTGSPQVAIQALQKKWAILLPGAPFEYVFQDQTVQNLYIAELKLQRAVFIAGMLALLIVLLGIFGLVSISIRKRTKEIGIRKVLGSPVYTIILLFAKDILPVTLAGGLLACPLSYLLMHDWLGNYAYRIDLSLFPFVICIACLVLITGLLILLQTLKTAMMSPVQSLRSE